MNQHLTIGMFCLILFCIIVETARELCFKRGATNTTFWQSLRHPIVLLGIMLWVIELITWTNVLMYVPLGIAFPLTALNYVIVVLGGAWLLKEHITKRHLLGSLLIAGGVALIGTTGM